MAGIFPAIANDNVIILAPSTRAWGLEDIFQVLAFRRSGRKIAYFIVLQLKFLFSIEGSKAIFDPSVPYSGAARVSVAGGDERAARCQFSAILFFGEALHDPARAGLAILDWSNFGFLPLPHDRLLSCLTKH